MYKGIKKFGFGTSPQRAIRNVKIECNIVKFKGLYFSFKSSGYEAEIFSIISDKVSVLLNFIDNANVAYDNYTKTVGIKEEDEVFENMKQNMIKLYGYEILEACISNLMKKYVCRLMR
jgi:hypothetical protein